MADLDYSHLELWDYQIETLKTWARLVDGFRCDVAPLVPLEFWKRARAEVATVRPGCFWLCESVERGFHVAARAQGFASLSDAELYQAFDAAYDYDVYPYFRDYLEGAITLAQYADRLDAQEWLLSRQLCQASASLKIMTAPARPTSSRRRPCAATGRPSTTSSAA